MSTAANAAPQETQEQIDARMAEEAALSGEDYVPLENIANTDAAPAATLADAGADELDSGKPEYDAETLASIAGDEKPVSVPHARFNEVNVSRKAAEKRVHELEVELARLNGKAEATTPGTAVKADEPTVYDFDDAEERYAAAILDGDTGKAKSIRAEMRTKQQEEADRRAEALADRRYKTNKAADDALRTKLEFEVELNKSYATFPFLNADSADSNQDAIDEVLVWHQAFMSKGKSPSEALAAAVAKIGPRYAKSAEKVLEPAAEVKPDIQKGLDRAGKVPGKPQGVGARAATFDVSKMTGKELKALSPEDEASLAGDIV